MEADYGTAKWVEREEAHSRHVLNTAKLVVTFSAAIAATFVAAAMQENDTAAWSEIAAGLMLVTLLVTLRVVRLKRASSVDPSELANQPTGEVQAALLAAAIKDKESAKSAHRLMVWQVRLSVLSSVVAAIGLFVGE